MTADVVLPRGSRLVLEPGTVVRFGYRDDDGDGWGDASLRVEGELMAQGTPEAPVVFTSTAEPAEPGAWGEIRIDYGSFDLRYAVVEGSTRGLHSHFSQGRLTDSVLRRNVDGTRLGASVVELAHCLFYGHPGKALNARKCRNRIQRNVFHHNRNAVFLFEADEGSAFEENRFRHNEHPFRLGDFFEGSVAARGNDWGRLPPRGPEEGGSGEPRIRTEPGQVADAGPRAWPVWREAWEAEIGEPVVAGPVITDEGVYVASANGASVRLGLLDGRVLPVGKGGRHRVAVLEAAAMPTLPAEVEGAIYRADGAGRLHAVQRATGRSLWTRNLGAAVGALPVRVGGGDLAVPVPTGRLYLLDAATGLERDCWQAGEGVRMSRTGAGSRVAVGNRGGSVWALDAVTFPP